MHDIDYIKNQIMITESDTQTNYLRGLLLDDDDHAARVNKLRLYIII
jgi:hypothetical protein